MEENKRAAKAAPSPNETKVQSPTDLYKVLEFFRYTVGTTLDCMCATGILRNCITWYVRDLEELGLLQAIYTARDKRTNFLAKHYSADPTKWVKPQSEQLSLFGEGMLWK